MIFNFISTINGLLWISHFCTIRPAIGILFMICYITYMALDYKFVLNKCY